MNDELKLMLLSTRNCVERKREERKKEKEKIINDFYNKVIKNSQELHIWIIKTIISDYIHHKTVQVRNLYQDTDYIDQEDDRLYKLTLPKIFTVYSLGDLSIDSDETEDMPALNLLKEKNIIIPDLLLNNKKNLVIWTNSNPSKIAIIYDYIFQKYGIKIENNSLIEIQAKNIGIIEYFIRKALANEISITFDLDENTINDFKKKLTELDEIKKRIINFKEISKKNAELIQTKVLKELLNKYNDDSVNIHADRVLETELPVMFRKNTIDGIDETYQNIVNNYISSFNDLQYPKIIAFPYQKETDQKYSSCSYIPMFESDFNKAMEEIHVNSYLSFTKDEYYVSVIESELENFILGNFENNEKNQSK